MLGSCPRANKTYTCNKYEHSMINIAQLQNILNINFYELKKRRLMSPVVYGKYLDSLCEQYNSKNLGNTLHYYRHNELTKFFVKRRYVEEMSVLEMRKSLLFCPKYKSSKTWQQKVHAMPDNQVIAVYYRLARKGLVK